MPLNLWKMGIFLCPNVQTKCYDNRIPIKKLTVEKGRQCLYIVTLKRFRATTVVHIPKFCVCSRRYIA